MSWRTAAIALALVLSACVYQVDTAIPEGQSSFDAALIGRWVTESDTAVISVGNAGGYRIEYTDDKGETTRLVGKSGKLGQRTILEVTPVIAGDESGDWPVGKLLLVVNVTGDRATTQLLDPGTMRATLASDPTAFAHIRRGDNVVLTAPSGQMIPALRAYLDRPGALDEPATWRRITRGQSSEGPGSAMQRPQPAASAPRRDLPIAMPDPPVEEGGGLPCAIHRGVAMVGGAGAGAVAGWFVSQMLYADRDAGGDLKRAYMIGGAILGVVIAWRDPAPPPPTPIRCHRRPAAHALT